MESEFAPSPSFTSSSRNLRQQHLFFCCSTVYLNGYIRRVYIVGKRCCGLQQCMRRIWRRDAFTDDVDDDTEMRRDEMRSCSSRGLHYWIIIFCCYYYYPLLYLLYMLSSVKVYLWDKIRQLFFSAFCIPNVFFSSANFFFCPQVNLYN